MTHARQTAETAPEPFSRTTIVKWKSPAEEIMGAAQVVGKLIERKLAQREDICIAVPNRNWALQAHRGMQAAEVSSTVCVPVPRLSAAEHAALAALDALAQPDGDAGRAQWQKCGRSLEELDGILAEHRNTRGFALVRVLGIDALPAFEHGRLHVRGTETAAELARILRTQLVRPTMPHHTIRTPIMHYRAVAGDFDYVFLIGCVDGLIPGPPAFEADDEDARERAKQTSRDAFLGMTTRGAKRTIVSYFSAIDERIADSAHIRYRRARHSHGETLAMCSPTMFLNEAGAQRPTTIGGQTFLREFDVN